MTVALNYRKLLFEAQLRKKVFDGFAELCTDFKNQTKRLVNLRSNFCWIPIIQNANKFLP